jgi:hypothetical protein
MVFSHASGRYEAIPILAETPQVGAKGQQIKQALQFCEILV